MTPGLAEKAIIQDALKMARAFLKVESFFSALSATNCAPNSEKYYKHELGPCYDASPP
jgi:hypothetical protein